jgi:hypothetical protein
MLASSLTPYTYRMARQNSAEACSWLASVRPETAI